MKLLEDRIRRDGIVAPGEVLRIDSFLNHQMDVALLDEMAKEIARLYAADAVDKVLTVEASGIAIACLVALEMGVPMVFAKKSKTSNIPDDLYVAQVKSYTHGNVNNVVVSKAFLHPGERVLIVDDFLASGEALNGMISLVEQAGATVAGAAIAVEKAFQPGGAEIRGRGYRVESLARVASMSVEDGIRFVGE